MSVCNLSIAEAQVAVFSVSFRENRHSDLIIQERECALLRHSSKKPQGQVLIYPSLGGKYLDLDSYSEKQDAPGLSRDDVDSYTQYWGGDNPDINDPAPCLFHQVKQVIGSG